MKRSHPLRDSQFNTRCIQSAQLLIRCRWYLLHPFHLGVNDGPR